MQDVREILKRYQMVLNGLPEERQGEDLEGDGWLPWLLRKVMSPLKGILLLFRPMPAVNADAPG